MTNLEKYEEALLREIYGNGPSEQEFSMFLEIIKKTGLDPLTKQIYLIGRWDSKQNKTTYTPQTSIDGYRLIAQRSSEYEGQTPAFWCGQDGVWKDVWLDQNPPAAAKIGVRRRGFLEPISVVALYKSYSQNNMFWKKFPDLMLAKCAEALALRKAFPQEMAGIYTAEEMPDHADVKVYETKEELKIEEKPKPSNMIEKPISLSTEDLALILKTMEQKALTSDQVKKLAKSMYDVESPRFIKKEKLEEFIFALKGE